MKLTGTPDAILAAVLADWPDAAEALATARALVPVCKREVLLHEAACLYAVARQYDRPGARLLEIGTALGYSAAVMALAAPRAGLVTLNPKRSEYAQAVTNLVTLKNVRLLPMRSWDCLADFQSPCLDMVFVDGNHDQVERDLPWYDRLKPGGLILFHDYSPAESKRPCAPVYDAVNRFAARLRREPDILVVDSRLRGLAGWYRQLGEGV